MNCGAGGATDASTRMRQRSRPEVARLLGPRPERAAWSSFAAGERRIGFGHRRCLQEIFSERGLDIGDEFAQNRCGLRFCDRGLGLRPNRRRSLRLGWVGRQLPGRKLSPNEDSRSVTNSLRPPAWVSGSGSAAARGTGAGVATGTCSTCNWFGNWRHRLRLDGHFGDGRDFLDGWRFGLGLNRGGFFNRNRSFFGNLDRGDVVCGEFFDDRFDCRRLLPQRRRA